MQWSFRLPAVGRQRRSRRAGAAVGSSHGQPRRSNTAMAGIEVSPVHGRHCICERCERQSSSAA